MSDTMTYKNYIAKVHYSSDDKCFYGKIATINDLITFEAKTVDGLEKNFKDSVDDYINTCKQLGREPQKTYKGSFNLRIDAKLHAVLHQRALQENLSLNAFIGKSLKNIVYPNKTSNPKNQQAGF